MTQVVSMVIVMFLLLNKTGKSHSVEDEKIVSMVLGSIPQRSRT
jgi:hypothetical protein